MLEKEKVAEIIEKYGKNEKDSGSVPVQIVMLTEKIMGLAEHIRKHHKDFSSRRGMLKAIARRRSLLEYLSKKDYETYYKLIKDLKLRG